MGRGKRTQQSQRLARASAGVAVSDSDGRSRLAMPFSTPAPEPKPKPVPARRQSSSPAANAAARKQEKPELYCPTPRCLWLTGHGYCERHGGAKWTDERQLLARKASSERATQEELELLYQLAAV